MTTPILTAWRAFETNLVAPHATDAQRVAIRRTYYLGAMEMYRAIKQALLNDPAAAAELMRAVGEEAVEWARAEQAAIEAEKEKVIQ